MPAIVGSLLFTFLPFHFMRGSLPILDYNAGIGFATHSKTNDVAPDRADRHAVPLSNQGGIGFANVTCPLVRSIFHQANPTGTVYVVGDAAPLDLVDKAGGH